jgi:hypothetical protein
MPTRCAPGFLRTPADGSLVVEAELLREVGDYVGKFVGNLLLGRAGRSDRGRCQHEVRRSDGVGLHQVKGLRSKAVGEIRVRSLLGLVRGR